MNFIVNGTPKLCSLYDLIKYYVNHQEQILIRATNFDKDKAEKRLHILKGLIIGIGKIIPGVSGSMLAISMGVYQKLIDSVNNFFKDKFKLLSPLFAITSPWLTV